MAYVIIRNDDGAYVALPGSASSYTPALQKARTWVTREAAERETCGNETVIHTDDIFFKNFVING